MYLSNKQEVIAQVLIKKGYNMVYVSIDDFYAKASTCARLTRKEENDCANKMKDGDIVSGEKLIESYIPMVASHIAVDSFDNLSAE